MDRDFEHLAGELVRLVRDPGGGGVETPEFGFDQVAEIAKMKD